MRFVLSVVAAVALCGTALAATPADPSQVQQALKSQGFDKWESAELDNGVWEVDDAIDASGRKFDLRIDAKTMKVITKVAE